MAEDYKRVSLLYYFFFFKKKKKRFVSLSSYLLFLDGRTHVDLGVSTEASGPSHPVLPPEASSHSASVPAVNPHPQDQTNVDLGPERTEGEA